MLIIRQLSNNQKSQKEGPDLIKKFCSFSHKRGSCPPYGKCLINCTKKNHSAKFFNIKKVNNVYKYEHYSESDENSEFLEYEALLIYMLYK